MTIKHKIIKKIVKVLEKNKIYYKDILLTILEIEEIFEEEGIK